jgi:phosphotransferase system HPr-like phosphotransfer protein
LYVDVSCIQPMHFLSILAFVYLVEITMETPSGLAGKAYLPNEYLVHRINKYNSNIKLANNNNTNINSNISLTLV